MYRFGDSKQVLGRTVETLVGSLHSYTQMKGLDLVPRPPPRWASRSMLPANRVTPAINATKGCANIRLQMHTSKACFERETSRAMGVARCN
jgi:hypothetical protein